MNLEVLMRQSIRMPVPLRRKFGISVRLIPIIIAGALWNISGNAFAVAPEIIGSERFISKVHAALNLLETRDADAYAIVIQFVGRIVEGRHSGMWAFIDPPTFEIGHKTAVRASVTWIASIIAHDSFHSKLYHDYKKDHPGRVPTLVWTGVKVEQICMRHQLAVMERIGSPTREIDRANKMADGHYVKDYETREDYERRKW